ncbi:hypothetical protein SEA_GUDMIT_53 [Gordonia phage Gudmit]|nr:hypothetical protein SEA_GUDMIT_53 [Gordonia phage Gudmit]
MSDDVRADARRLREGITPEKWVKWEDFEAKEFTFDGIPRRDAEFIAAAPTLVDRLLTELDRAKALIGRVTDDAGADPDEDPDDLCNWVAELRSGASDAETHRMANHRLVATLKQVRELHGAVMLHDWVCTACDEPWPCDTLRTLDGGAR